MDKAALLALADRVEALTGPDREMDAAIWAIGTLREWPPRLDILAQAYRDNAPRYTASIDSAMTLVPEGYGFMVDGFKDAWFADLDAGQQMSAHATTPALALTAAALRARASQ